MEYELFEDKDRPHKKKKLHELLDKYGTIDELEQHGSVEDNLEYMFSGNKELLDEVLAERKMGMLKQPLRQVQGDVVQHDAISDVQHDGGSATSSTRRTSNENIVNDEENDVDDMKNHTPKTRQRETLTQYARESLPATSRSSLDDEDMAKNAAKHPMFKTPNEDMDVSVLQNAERIRRLKSKLSHLGYYQGEMNGFLTPGFKKAINDYSEDNQFSNQNVYQQMKLADKKLSSVENLSHADFDGNYLRIIENGKIVMQIPAMSGRAGYQERKYQSVKDKGPIPEGSYRLRQSNMQEINALQGIGGILADITHRGTARGGYPAWGKRRVWLEPFSSNNMYNRDKFSIHGGASLGSAGCIDISGHTQEFFDKFKSYGNDMILKVRYPQEKIR